MLVLREKLSDGLVREWEIKKVYAHEKTQHQDVLIAETSHGRTLFCDNERQSSSLTQLLYHEAQVYPALMYLENARSALVIGSSEGVVPQLLKEVGFESIVHVDLDRRCMELCAEHLDYGYSPATNEFQLIFADGIDYLKTCTYQYDLIVLDLPDISYYTKGVWQEMLRLAFPYRLTSTGILITQAGCPTYWRNEGLKTVYNLFHEATDKRLFISAEQEWSWMLLSACVFPRPRTEEFERMWFNRPAVHYTPADLLAGIYTPNSLRVKN